MQLRLSFIFISALDAKEKQSERGPIQPKHIREAVRRLRSRGAVVTTKYKKKLLVWCQSSIDVVVTWANLVAENECCDCSRTGQRSPLSWSHKSLEQYWKTLAIISDCRCVIILWEHVPASLLTVAPTRECKVKPAAFIDSVWLNEFSLLCCRVCQSQLLCCL